jgi:hypothetical protein
MRFGFCHVRSTLILRTNTVLRAWLHRLWSADASIATHRFAFVLLAP